MAKRSYSKKGSKIEPSVLSLLFETTAGSAIDAKYIDLSQCASLMNRRFYRQGINWVVRDIKFMNLEPQSNAQIVIGKLPNTWVMSNAWEKGFRAWQRMNREALSETDSVRPKFLDFKIYADAEHHALGFDGNLLPRAFAAASTATAGEWIASKVVQPKTDGTDDVQERELIACGSNYPGTSPVSGHNAVSLIEGYAASRGLPNVIDPNVPDDAASANDNIPANWLASMFNEGTDQTEAVLEDMITENNIAPYPFENATVGATTFTDTQYPGGANQLPGVEMHDFELITSTTVGGTTRFKGGNFPYGLMKIGTFGFAESSNIILQVNLVPGDHRGYLCESMTEM
jgi:hypothetical protein